MENRDNPLSGKNFSLPVFLKHSAERSLTECFGTVGQNNFDGKSERGLKNRKDRAPFLPYQFSVPEIDETLKDSPTIFFDIVRQNFRW